MQFMAYLNIQIRLNYLFVKICFFTLRMQVPFEQLHWFNDDSQLELLIFQEITALAVIGQHEISLPDFAENYTSK